jgi:hypothetical protein
MDTCLHLEQNEKNERPRHEALLQELSSWPDKLFILILQMIILLLLLKLMLRVLLC